MAVLGGLAAFGVFAAFSSTTTNTSNSFAAGTVVITDNDAGAAMYTLTNHKPGVGTQCINVSYAGSLASDVRLYSPAIAGTGANDINLTSRRAPGGASIFPGCTGFTPDAGDLYNGTLAVPDDLRHRHPRPARARATVGDRRLRRLPVQHACPDTTPAQGANGRPRLHVGGSQPVTGRERATLPAARGPAPAPPLRPSRRPPAPITITQDRRARARRRGLRRAVLGRTRRAAGDPRRGARDSGPRSVSWRSAAGRLIAGRDLRPGPPAAPPPRAAVRNQTGARSASAARAGRPRRPRSTRDCGSRAGGATLSTARSASCAAGAGRKLVLPAEAARAAVRLAGPGAASTGAGPSESRA